MVSDWEGEGEGESVQDGVFEGEEEPPLVEPPEEAKLFVGNLPYDVDSEKLAMLFEQAGIVEIAEVGFSSFSESWLSPCFLGVFFFLWERTRLPIFRFYLSNLCPT